ncbi:MAG: His/Gly/Thr/Pro-type tRNA ligase C-terminal domain-containing protein, partial [Oligoflexus sp.]
AGSRAWNKVVHSFNKKIRSHTMRKVPVLLIIGQKEADEGHVTVRRYGIQEQKTMERDVFVRELLGEIKDRVMHRQPMGALL